MAKQPGKIKNKTIKPGGSKFVPDPKAFANGVKKANEILNSLHV
jgi:hypothetical protein